MTVTISTIMQGEEAKYEEVPLLVCLEGVGISQNGAIDLTIWH